MARSGSRSRWIAVAASASWVATSPHDAITTSGSSFSSTEREFDSLFTVDKPVIFNFHGYLWLIHKLAAGAATVITRAVEIRSIATILW
jgi:XFP-like protein